MTCRSSHFSVSYRPASQMVTRPPPYSPAAIVPSNDAYSSGWSSVGTASRLTPGSSGGALGTAQLFSTPARSNRRSQWIRSSAPRGVWCSWTTKVSSCPAGSSRPSGGTGSAVRAGSRLARYSASGSDPRSDVLRRRAGTSGGAAGPLGRRLLGRLPGGRLLGGRLLGGRLLRRRPRRARGRRPLLGRRRLLGRRGLLGRRRLLGRRALLGRNGLLGRRPRRRVLLRTPAAGPLHALAQGAH